MSFRKSFEENKMLHYLNYRLIHTENRYTRNRQSKLLKNKKKKNWY